MPTIASWKSGPRITRGGNMRDVDRAAVTKYVYKRLADANFRDRLIAAAPDGTRPIAVALREDPLGSLLSHIDNLGGACNVVVPLLNGIVVVAFEISSTPPSSAQKSRSKTGKTPMLTTACTVGVFIERLRLDAMDAGEATYAFRVEGDKPSSEAVTGKAGVVALAG